MEASILPVITQLGVAAFAIYIMYMMYKDSSSRMDKKDDVLLEQIEDQKRYMREVHSSTVTQLTHASRVIEDNIKAYERVINVLDSHK